MVIMGKDNCNEYLRKTQKPYPRTCKECGLGPCKHQESSVTRRPLSSLSKEDYYILNKMGFLYEFYPEATGDWKKDTAPNLTDSEKIELAKKLVKCLCDIIPMKDAEYVAREHNESVSQLKRIFQ